MLSALIKKQLPELRNSLKYYENICMEKYKIVNTNQI